MAAADLVDGVELDDRAERVADGTAEQAAGDGVFEGGRTGHRRRGYVAAEAAARAPGAIYDVGGEGGGDEGDGAGAGPQVSEPASVNVSPAAATNRQS